MELATCVPTETWNFEAAPKFLENLLNPAMSSTCSYSSLCCTKCFECI